MGVVAQKVPHAAGGPTTLVLLIVDGDKSAQAGASISRRPFFGGNITSGFPMEGRIWLEEKV